MGFKTIRCQCGIESECWTGTSIIVHHDHGTIYFNSYVVKNMEKKERYRGSFYLDAKHTQELINQLIEFKKMRVENEEELSDYYAKRRTK